MTLYIKMKVANQYFITLSLIRHQYKYICEHAKNMEAHKPNYE